MAISTRPSITPAVHGHAPAVRDLRSRFGAPEVYGAECTCGWTGQRREGQAGERLAVLDAMRHRDEIRFGASASRSRARGSIT